MHFLGSGSWCLYLEPSAQAAVFTSDETLFRYVVGPVEVNEARLALLVLRALRDEESWGQLLLALLGDFAVPSDKISDRRSEGGLILSLTSFGMTCSWNRESLTSPSLMKYSDLSGVP